MNRETFLTFSAIGLVTLMLLAAFGIYKLVFATTQENVDLCHFDHGAQKWNFLEGINANALHGHKKHSKDFLVDDGHPCPPNADDHDEDTDEGGGDEGEDEGGGGSDTPSDDEGDDEEPEGGGDSGGSDEPTDDDSDGGGNDTGASSGGSGNGGAGKLLEGKPDQKIKLTRKPKDEPEEPEVDDPTLPEMPVPPFIPYVNECPGQCKG